MLLVTVFNILSFSAICRTPVYLLLTGMGANGSCWQKNSDKVHISGGRIFVRRCYLYHEPEAKDAVLLDECDSTIHIYW